MGRTLFISASQLSAFKECRRKWHLQSQRKLEPVSDDRTALLVGTAYHNALETFHGPGTKGDRLEAALDAFEASLRSVGAVEVDLGEGVESIEAFDDFEVARGRGVLRAYAAYEMTRLDMKLGVLDEVERGFPNFSAFSAKRQAEIEALTLGEVNGTQVVLVGRYDGLLASSPVEHKTASNITAVEPRDLELDEQVSAMCWAVSRLHGRQSLGAVYNVLVKPSHRPNPRGRTETPAQFEQRIVDECLSGASRFFVRYAAPRTPAFLDAWRRQALDVAADMIAGRHYPRLRGSWDGPCRRCAFHEACCVWHEEARRETVLRAGFRPRTYR